MPLIVRWYVKSALVNLVLAAFFGLAAVSGLEHWAAIPLFWHLLVVGWLTQLIFGIALWMLPSFTRARPRRNEALNWAAWGLLNAGLLLRILSEPWHYQMPAARGALFLSALLQWLAAVLFVYNIWSRVRGPRRQRPKGD